ncbi:MAG: Gldg family protein, partial [Planctomycetota bacterium]
MTSLFTIFKRELKSYFISPIGYVFIVTFLLINCGLFVTGFFASDPQVLEMRSFFGNLPIILCVFLPLVTMRLWAEEKKSNTQEMLLTFPMPTWAIVAGKYLASLAFFVIALVGTLILPIMLVQLANNAGPDMGQIVCSYIGVVLLAGMFLALGLFLSSLVADQIVAAVLGVLACFGMYLLGLDFIAGSIDAWWPSAELGSLLKRYLGVATHYNIFTRGVFEVGHLLYFVVWTAIFLLLNGYYVEGRNRPYARLIFASAVVLALALGLGVNAIVAGGSLGRIDMTENDLYSFSPVSRDVLSELDSDVTLNYYVSPARDLPSHLKTLEQDVMWRLEELAIRSGGKVNIQKHTLDARALLSSLMGTEEEDDDEDKASLEKRMLDKGLEPMSVQVAEAAGSQVVLMYSAIGIAYKDKPEQIVNSIMPSDLDQLEYRLVNTIFRLTRTRKPVVALVAPIDEISSQMRMMYMQMGRPVPPPRDNYRRVEQALTEQDYEVRRVKLTKQEPLPDKYDVLVMIEPRELNDRQQWEIARALAQGKPTILAASKVFFREQQTQRGLEVDLTALQPGVNRILEPLGVTLDDRVLMAPDTAPLPYYYINVTDFNPDSPVVGHLKSMMMAQPVAVKMDRDKLKENKLDVVELATSPPNTVARSVEMYRTAGQDFFNFRGASAQAYPLAVRVTGTMPFAFAEMPRPEWPDTSQQPGMPPQDDQPDPPAGPLEAAPGDLLLIGNSLMFLDPLTQQMSQ